MGTALLHYRTTFPPCPRLQFVGSGEGGCFPARAPMAGQQRAGRGGVVDDRDADAGRQRRGAGGCRAGARLRGRPVDDPRHDGGLEHRRQAPLPRRDPQSLYRGFTSFPELGWNWVGGVMDVDMYVGMKKKNIWMETFA